MNVTHQTHPSRDELAAFLAGKLNAVASDSIRQHLNECESCCDELDTLPADDTIVTALRQEDLETSVAPEMRADGPIAPTIVPESVEETRAPRGQATEVPGLDVAKLKLPAELRDHPRYRIVELLGHGGMGDVYRAEHKVMNRQVALKVIKPQLVQNDAAVRRFQREVQAAAQLRHPNDTGEYWWDRLVMADNETVVIALGSQVKFLNLKSGKSETKVKYSTAVNCTSVAMSADEETLLVGTKWFKDAVEQDKGVHVWNTAQWREAQRCDGPTAAVSSVDFLPGERHIISGSEDGRIFIWDRATGREVARKEGLGHLANAVIPLADGRHAVSFGGWYVDKENDPTAGDFAIRLWQLPVSVFPEEYDD